MSKIEESIKLLKKVERVATMMTVAWDDYKKAIGLLESGPDPTEFTKDIREQVQVDECNQKSARGWLCAKLIQSCDIIDRLTAENVKLKEQIANRECIADNKGYCGYSQETMNALIKERDDLTIENKRLMEIKALAYEACSTGNQGAELKCINLCDEFEKFLKGESNEQRTD